MPAFWEENLEALDPTEVNWGASTILAIFFAASLVSAVFFGLGYSFGRGIPKPGVSIGFTGMNVPAIDSDSNQFTQHHDRVASTINARETTVPTRTDSAKPIHPVLTNTSMIHSASDVALGAVKPPAEVHARTAIAKADVAHYMVQVGAIGDRKDAKVLVSRLRKSGFHAGIYPGKHDKFLHVQIGPFANEEQAKTMRYHVTVSGYRAILKHAS